MKFVYLLFSYVFAYSAYRAFQGVTGINGQIEILFFLMYGLAALLTLIFALTDL